MPLSDPSGNIPSFLRAMPRLETQADAEALREKGADINEKGPREMTPLLEAVCNTEQHAIAHWLIDQGADLNAQSSDGYTALHYAAINGFTDLARHLLERGADIGLKALFGNTALMLAEHHNHPEIAGLIKEAAKSLPPAKQQTLRAHAPRIKLKQGPGLS